VKHLRDSFSLAVLCDGQTNRQTQTLRQIHDSRIYRANIASRGKKNDDGFLYGITVTDYMQRYLDILLYVLLYNLFAGPLGPLANGK